ncbi:TonB-dependent siderophore receptor [Endobacterium cereale]|uniref:TonB-dependent siderophore receptor n=1 Tax=Endobacterium cereale TaxID=2663029 RepID=UPI002B465666|nr:TonB-dependent siderophore receptor [Endobacterium cereale]MEB2845734.1 TonB-dependent siderophore receptor [Endobacterium cereale]
MTRSFSLKIFLGISVSSLALVAPAHAQDQQGTVLETIVVEGAAGTSAREKSAAATGPVKGYVAAQSAGGTKTTTPLIETPQSISVITTQQLEDRGVQNLGEALSYTAGVVAAPFGNDARYFNPIMRGFEAVDSVYINSFRFIRDFGALSFEPYGQERIEVIKGPASVLYGQGEPGGIINLVAKRPTFEKFGEIGVEFGNNDRYQIKLDAGDVHNDVVSYRITALGRLADGEQDFTSDDRLYLAPSFTWAPDEDTSLTILGSLQRDTGTSPLGLPQAGTLDFNPNGVIPTSRYIGEPDFNDNKSLLATVGYEFKHRFNETFEFRQNAQYLSFDADYNNLYYSSLGADLRTVNRGVSVQSEDTDSFGIDNQLEANFETGALEHTAIVGFDYRYYTQDRSSLFDSVGSIDVFNPVYGSPLNYNVALTDYMDHRLQQVGIYAQDQISIDRLRLTFGLRQDWSDIRGNTFDGGRNTRTISRNKDNALTGRAAALYLFDNGLAPYISYSTSFNPQPGLNTTIGELLDASEGEMIEAGLKFQPEGWNSMFTASVYQLTKTNITGTVRDQNGDRVTQQVGEAKSRGFELEATTSLAEGLDLLGSYTYSDTQITTGGFEFDGPTSTSILTTGNQLANIPQHSAALWVAYTFQEDTALEGLKLGAGARYVGERYGNNTNTIKLPDTTLFDASVSFEKENIKASLAVQNIADKRYAASCNFGCFYGEGRTIVGSLTYKW